MRKKPIKLRPKRIVKILLYSIVFFALIKPDSLEHIGLGWLNSALVIIDVILMGVMAYRALIGSYKISSATLLISLIYLVIGISTLLGTLDFISLVKVAGTAIGVGLFTDYCLQKDPKVYFQSSIFTLSVLFTINLFTIIKYYPVGMYRLDYVVGDLYFMGHDNGMIYNLIPLCSLSFIYSYAKKKKIWTFVSLYSIALTLFSEIYVKSATGILATFLLIIMLILIRNKMLNKILKPKIIFLAFFILNISIIIFKVQNSFSWLFVDILKKDLTFTGRTYLWDYALGLIKNRLIIGYGMGVDVIGNGHAYPHAHSLVLDLLFKGGILALMLFIFLLANFNANYKKANDKIISKLLLLPIAVLLFCEITSAMPYKAFFWSLIVMTNSINDIKRIPEGKKEENAA